jgi:hypothetical protein
MTCSLIFRLPENSSLDLVRQHFSERKNYTVSVNQAVYKNEDTENIFFVDLTDESETDAPEIVGEEVTFQINYFRPKSYLGDVIPELRAFESKFDCRFYDENTGQIENFSLASFEQSWNEANTSIVRNLPKKRG